MRNLQEATERICELKGSVLALEALAAAALHGLAPRARHGLRAVFERQAEVARALLLHAPISEHTIAAFDRDAARTLALLDAGAAAGAPPAADPLLLTTVRIATFADARALSGATGFFFERDGRLWLVTSRHVLIDEPGGHRPDRIEIGLHTDAHDLTRSAVQSLPLYRDGRAGWREARDPGGPIDVALLELERSALPQPAVLQAFTPANLRAAPDAVEVGEPLGIVGYPPGSHDTLHHLPVLRQATLASAFGLRFQGRGHFLTDGGAYRGSSGAPVVQRDASAPGALPWALLGVVSGRPETSGRDRVDDESPGLNGACYADVLLALSAR